MINIGAQWSFISLWAELSKGIVYCSDSNENLFKVIKISLIYLL